MVRNQVHKEIYEAIDKYQQEKGYSPSLNDLCNMTGRRSKGTICCILRTMKKRGLVDYEPKGKRTITLNKEMKLPWN